MRKSLLGIASAVGLFLTVGAPSARAVSIGQLLFLNNVTIQSLTLNEDITEAPNEGSINFPDAMKPAQCLYGAIKYNATSDIGKAIHGTLLAARAANRPVTIGYEKVQSGYVFICTLRNLRY